MSSDSGVSWDHAYSANGVLVIVPGAGTATNPEEFSLVKSVCTSERSQYVEYGDAYDRFYYEYPHNWSAISQLRIPATQTHCDGGLMTLAWRIKCAILTKEILPPAVIIAGSRGSQITLPLLLQDCWKGAVVCLNAGIFTVDCSALPTAAPLIAISFEHDYFATKDPQFTMAKTQTSQPARGWLLHLLGKGHMQPLPPKLLFVTVVLAATGRTPNEYNLSNSDGLNTEIRCLQMC